MPSFYALEVARALTGRVPEPQQMEREAAAASEARLAWPAPGDPMRAIDEVEHDLATLRALLRGRESRGRARYLLELNDYPGWCCTSERALQRDLAPTCFALTRSPPGTFSLDTDRTISRASGIIVPLHSYGLRGFRGHLEKYQYLGVPAWDSNPGAHLRTTRLGGAPGVPCLVLE